MKILIPQNRYSRFIITMMLLTMLAPYFCTPGITGAAGITPREILQCVNEMREERGNLKEIFPDELLHKAASLKLQDMMEHGYWRHENPVIAKKPWDFVDEAGYPYLVMGENLAIGYQDSAEVCAAWKKSPSHLANIINPEFTEAGIAYDRASLEEGGKGILVVMMFAAPDRSPPASSLSPGDGSLKKERDKSSQIKIILAIAIIFSYALTLAIIFINYVVPGQKKQKPKSPVLAIACALVSIALTIFLLIMLI